MNCFALAGIQFGVAEAEFEGFLLGPSELVWGLRVSAVPQAVPPSTELWYPYAEMQEFAGLTNKAVQSWDNLLPLKISWTRSSAVVGEAAFSVFGSCFSILEGKIAVSRVAGNRVQIDWAGQTDVMLEAGFPEIVPFEISAEGCFAGIRSFCDEEALARFHLDEYLPAKEFAFVVHKGKNYFVP